MLGTVPRFAAFALIAVPVLTFLFTGRCITMNSDKKEITQ